MRLGAFVWSKFTAKEAAYHLLRSVSSRLDERIQYGNVGGSDYPEAWLSAALDLRNLWGKSDA
jgi:hypothetical protein